jgi:hypothetical protein
MNYSLMKTKQNIKGNATPRQPIDSSTPQGRETIISMLRVVPRHSHNRSRMHAEARSGLEGGLGRRMPLV